LLFFFSLSFSSQCYIFFNAYWTGNAFICASASEIMIAGNN
jgi:hypothetical protein